MTKRQRIDHKKANAARRDMILRNSKGKKLGDNLCIYLGGVVQKSKFSRV